MSLARVSPNQMSISQIKKSLLIIVSISVLFSALFSSAAFAGEVKKGNEGMYWATYNSITNNRVTYQVDTKSRLCYIIFRGGTGGGINTVDCKNFAMRDEWKKIITWEK